MISTPTELTRTWIRAGTWGAIVLVAGALIFANCCVWRRWSESDQRGYGTFTAFGWPRDCLEMGERVTLHSPGQSQTHFIQFHWIDACINLVFFAAVLGGTGFCTARFLHSKQFSLVALLYCVAMVSFSLTFIDFKYGGFCAPPFAPDMWNPIPWIAGITVLAGAGATVYCTFALAMKLLKDLGTRRRKTPVEFGTS